MDAIEAIIKRRTHKRFTGAPVERGQLEQLLELATWAPNHKMTEPWRFFVVPQEGIAGLLEAVRRGLTAQDPPAIQRKRDKLEQRVPALGAFINVARIPVPEDPVIDREDYAACCCAVQNIMLGATALGLGSFWSTGALFDRLPVREFLGMTGEMERVASLWLGVPSEEVESRRTPFSELTVWIGEVHGGGGGG